MCAHRQLQADVQAEEDLKVIQGKLQDRVVEMTQVPYSFASLPVPCSHWQDTSEAHTHGEAVAKHSTPE